MSKILIMGGGDGFGGLTLAFQCAYFASLGGYDQVTVGLSCSDTAFDVLHYLFSDNYTIQKYPIEDSLNHAILYDEGRRAVVTAGYDEFYYVCPDLLFRNPYAFLAKEFGTNFATLKSTRLLTHKAYRQNIIYCALNSSTEGYSYSKTKELLRGLGETFPDYQIKVPALDNWAGIKLNVDQFAGPFPSNVTISKNPDIVESFYELVNSEFCVCLDNGASHVSYHLGHNRVLLDPRHNWKRETLPWRIRWRQTDHDSVPISTAPSEIISLIKLNKDIPQTELIPKPILINNLHGVDWAREMIWKF